MLTNHLGVPVRCRTPFSRSELFQSAFLTSSQGGAIHWLVNCTSCSKGLGTPRLQVRGPWCSPHKHRGIPLVTPVGPAICRAGRLTEARVYCFSSVCPGLGSNMEARMHVPKSRKRGGGQLVLPAMGVQGHAVPGSADHWGPV